MLRNRRLGTLLLVLTSFALAGGLAELGLRLAGYAALYDVYSKPELFWQHDPRLGWSLEPGARGRYVGPRPFPIEFDTTVEINSLGLRGPELPRREAGELRVLFLGDSVVAGLEVEQQETFVALLEAQLQRRMGRPLHVINAGVRGYGTDQSLLWYRERGRALAPDLVALVFSANDFDDNVTLHRARRPFGKGAFALRSTGALELVGVPVPQYPLCSAWILGPGYEPTRVDGPVLAPAASCRRGSPTAPRCSPSSPPRSAACRAWSRSSRAPRSPRARPKRRCCRGPRVDAARRGRRERRRGRRRSGNARPSSPARCSRRSRAMCARATPASSCS